MILNSLRSDKLSDIINKSHENGDLVKILPELSNLYTTNKGHKNNFYHTLGVLDNVVKYDNDNLKMKIVALLHDIGKIIVRTKNKNDNWTFHDHENVGAKMVFNILKRFNITNKKTKIAIVPVGYADGYDRGLLNISEVLIGGTRCKILGRVAMNMFVVDVTHLNDVSIEDEVVILGKQGKEEITAEEIAQKIDTINYEITTRISPLLPRIIV